MMYDDVWDEPFDYDQYPDPVDEAYEWYERFLLGEDDDVDTFMTKAERREAKRVKGRYGPIRHIDPDLRPKKLEKPRIHVRDKFKRGK